MKQFFFTILLMATAVLPTGAANHEVPLIQNVRAYESASLNGDWHYIVDVQEEGYYDYRMNPTRWGFFQNAKPQRPEDLIEYDFDKSPTMQIPRRVFRPYRCRTIVRCSTSAPSTTIVVSG